MEWDDISGIAVSGVVLGTYEATHMASDDMDMARVGPGIGSAMDHGEDGFSDADRSVPGVPTKQCLSDSRHRLILQTSVAKMSQAMKTATAQRPMAKRRKGKGRHLLLRFLLRLLARRKSLVFHHGLKTHQFAG